jgi:hypothetical protein
MTNYRFEEAITTDDGERVAFPILVHELHSRPYALEGVPEWASDDEIERAVAQLEAKLGFDLERPDDYDEVRLSDEEAADYYAKQAGLHPVTGEWIAR